MSLEEFLRQVKDVREYKRAQAVKLDLSGSKRRQTAQALSVSVNFVSKWRLQYDRFGVEGLRLQHKGSKGYLEQAEKRQVLGWMKEQAPYLDRETLESYLRSHYGVEYRSRRSYYDLLEEAAISYKKRQKINPDRKEEVVVARQEVIKKRSASSRIRSGKGK